MPTTSIIEDIQTGLKFIELLKTAKLDDSGLTPEDLENIRNPLPISDDLLNDPSFRLSLDLYLACTNAPQSTFNSLRNVMSQHHPDITILSDDQIKRRIKKIKRKLLSRL